MENDDPRHGMVLGASKIVACARISQVTKNDDPRYGRTCVASRAIRGATLKDHKNETENPFDDRAVRASRQ
jgi:predicted GNAT family N-acyltransferase